MKIKTFIHNIKELELRDKDVNFFVDDIELKGFIARATHTNTEFLPYEENGTEGRIITTVFYEKSQIKVHK